jgi:hypothetical protein
VSSKLPVTILIFFKILDEASKFDFNIIQKLVKITTKTAKGVENFYDGFLFLF